MEMFFLQKTGHLGFLSLRTLKKFEHGESAAKTLLRMSNTPRAATPSAGVPLL